jgi:hypothetical protein
VAEVEDDSHEVIIVFQILLQVEAIQDHLHIEVLLLLFSAKFARKLVILLKIVGIAMMMVSFIQ